MVRLVVPSPPERTLRITFGPSKALSLSRAVAIATEGVDTLESSGGIHRASYVLARDPVPYLHAQQLLVITGSWKATTVEVDGRPERSFIAMWMLTCAVEQLSRSGRCQAIFRTAESPDRCRSCALYEPEWALESWGRIDHSFSVIDGELYAPDIPAHVPQEWISQHPDAAERVGVHGRDHVTEEAAVKGLVGTMEAADALGVSVGKLRRLLASGVIPASKVGREWLISTQDVERFAARPPVIANDPRNQGPKSPKRPSTS